MDLMGRNEYARHRGCAPNAVKKAEDDGRIKPAVKRNPVDGKFVGIDWREADRLWAKNTDPVQAARSGQVIGAPAALTAPEGQLPLGEPDAAVQTSAPAEGSGGQQDAYYVARAKREEFAAKDAELKYLQTIEQLVSADELRTIAFRRYRALRDSFMAVAEQEAPILAAEKDPVQIRERLGRAFKKVLHELSDHARAEAARGDPERLAA